MNRLERFFEWFRSMGGLIPEEREWLLNKKFREVPEDRESSFKENPEEVKMKHNYVFNEGGKPSDSGDFDDYPDIGRLRFERKELDGDA